MAAAEAKRAAIIIVAACGGSSWHHQKRRRGTLSAAISSGIENVEEKSAASARHLALAILASAPEIIWP